MQSIRDKTKYLSLVTHATPTHIHLENKGTNTSLVAGRILYEHARTPNTALVTA